jgi:transposase-like protein
METMNLCSLSRYFHDEAAAWELLESLRWPDGPECPHCGEVGRATYLKPRDGQRTTSTGKVSYRRTWKCRNKECRRKFSVLVGSIFEDSKVPVSKWLMAFYLLTASKNGVAAYELHRTLGVTNKTAWFIFHRIREATKVGPLADLLHGTVMADEVYIGGDPKNRHAWQRVERDGRGTDKTPVVSIVDKDTGEVRSHVVTDLTQWSLGRIIIGNVEPAGSVLVTDGFKGYNLAASYFAKHMVVDHSAGEYARDGYSTNAVEGFFSQLKRSIDGTHHHVSVKHLGRYVAEHDFRYSTRNLSDTERMERLMRQTGGRRLTYQEVKAGPSND